MSDAVRKICVVTAARSEYSASKWLMKEILNDSSLKLQVVVTGAHLEKKFGYTIKELEADHIPIDFKVPMGCSNDDPLGMASSAADFIKGFSAVLERLSPDILVLLGDRYELLPICNTATLFKIPIAHISGGDITEGAMDDAIRHAITKLSHIHFPGTESSAQVILQMGESPDRVFVVGEPGLDNFRRLNCLSRGELAEEIGLNPNKNWILLTYHPETLADSEYDMRNLNNIFSVLDTQRNIQVLMTYPNADPGSQRIIDCCIEKQGKNPSRYLLEKNLGQLKFISFLKTAYCMIGNSSSIVFETPTAELPAVLVGNRQKGRIIANNILVSDGSRNSLSSCLSTVSNGAFRLGLKGMLNPYGDGNTAIKILKVLKQITLDNVLNKSFVKYPVTASWKGRKK